MRDFTRLPSFRIAQAEREKAQAIATAYANRDAWRPSAEAAAADKQARPTIAEAVAKHGGAYLDACRAEDGWVKHDGLGLPSGLMLDGRQIETLHRDGSKRVGTVAASRGWLHDWYPPNAQIVAYRWLAEAVKAAADANAEGWIKHAPGPCPAALLGRVIDAMFSDGAVIYGFPITTGAALVWAYGRVVAYRLSATSQASIVTDDQA